MRVANSIDFYIGRKVFVPLVSTLVLAAMLLLLEKMLNLFDFVISEGGPVRIVFQLLANLIPEMAGLAVPLALMMGILLAFRNLALSSELDAMRAVGLGYGRLLRIPFLYAFTLIAINVGIVGFVQPRSEYEYQRLEFELRSGALGASIKVGEFTTLGKNMTLRVEASENEGRVLHGVFIRLQDNRGRSIMATADHGAFMRSDDPNVILFRLTNGRLIHDEPSFPVPRVLSFTSQDLPIDLPAVENFRERGVNAGEEELTLPELVRVNADEQRPEEYRWKVRANFNFRLAEILVMLFLPFMAVALAVPPKRSSSGLGMFIGVVFVVAAHKLFQYGERTSAIGMGDPLLTIWLPFAGVVALMLWMFWTLAYKPGGQPIGGLERVVAKIGKWVAKITGTERRKRKRAAAFAAAE